MAIRRGLKLKFHELRGLCTLPVVAVMCNASLVIAVRAAPGASPESPTEVEDGDWAMPGDDYSARRYGGGSHNLATPRPCRASPFGCGIGLHFSKPPSLTSQRTSFST